MEIYLFHMVMFRVVEKLGLNRMFGTGWVQYAVTVILVLVGRVVFSAIMQRVIAIAEKRANDYLSRKRLIGKVG